MIKKRRNQTFITESVGDTIVAGKQLAAFLKSGDLVSLTGPLGAGKTCFIKGIALGRGVPESEIRSPSFTLINEYYGEVPIFHFDLYRMESVDELYGIGWNDYLLREGIMVVEWGEKAEEHLPEKKICVTISIVLENSRKIEVEFTN